MMLEKEQKPIICEILKLLRIINNYSIKDLSEKAGISVSYITDIEKGKKTKPSIDILDKYSKALGIKKTTIMYFQEEFEEKDYDLQNMMLEILLKTVKRQEIHS